MRSGVDRSEEVAVGPRLEPGWGLAGPVKDDSYGGGLLGLNSLGYQGPDAPILLREARHEKPTYTKRPRRIAVLPATRRIACF